MYFTQNQKDCCTSNGGAVVGVVEDPDVGVIGEDCHLPDGTVINPYTGEPDGSDGDPCVYFGTQEDSGNPFNWDGLNSLLSTLGGIAVPFLPFLFDDQTNPNIANNPQLARAEAERKQGQKLVIGFVILIALSVGVYMLMKRRK